MDNFILTLTDLMIDKNLSRNRLSKELNIASATINGYFNQGYFPKIEIAQKLAKYFDCSLDYLFGFDDKMKNNNKNDKPFIKNLEFLLKQRKISVHRLMKDLKMSEYNFYRWKKGMQPKTINIIDVAKYFDVPVDYLVGYVA